MLRLRKSSVITKEFGLAGDFERYFDIAKVDEEKHIVEGIMTKATIDNQEEIVGWDATKKAFQEFMKFGNVREMHRNDSAAGTVVDYKIDEGNKLIKVWAKIVDSKAWEKVKEGVYKGFSIGGKALKRVKEFIPELGKVVSIVKEYVLNEVSLVDRPAHPECVFTIAKRDGNYNDPLLSEVFSTERKLKVFKGKILTDGEISKLDDRSFGLIKTVRTRHGSIKKRYFAMPDKVHAQAVLNILEQSDLDTKEKLMIHKRAVEILGKRHKSDRCSYCHVLRKYKSLSLEEDELGRLRKRADKLEQAQDLLDEAQEDMEAASAGPDHVESENLRVARQRAEKDSKMREFEGSGYGDVNEGELDDYDEYDDEEGEYDEYPYEYEDEEGGVPHESYRGEIGYEEGQPVQTARTHILDSDKYRRAKAVPIDGEDKEGEFYPEDFEDAEDDEGEMCPYCSKTIQMALNSGEMRKGASIECPGCGTEYDILTKRHVQVVQKGAEGYADAPGDPDAEMFIEELAKRDEMIDRLCDRVEKLSGRMDKRDLRPKMRKGKVLRKGDIEGTEDQELEKAEKQLESDTAKAMNLRKISQKSGQPLSAEEEAFCEDVLDKRLEKHVS